MIRKLILLLTIFATITTSITAQTLTATFNGTEGSPMFQLISTYMNEVGEKIGYTINVRTAPLERAEVDLKSGKVDIDVGRTKFVYKDTDPVTYTTFPVLVSQYFFISKKDIDPGTPSTWRDLKLVTTRGNAVINDWISKNSIPESKVSYVKNEEAVLKSLTAGRADYTVSIGITYNAWMKSPEFTNSGINLIQPPAFPSPAFLVISNKNKDLIPKISQAVKELAESGRTAEIFAPPK